MPSSPDGQPRRKRARLACTACNARRVKCNVTESRPCHNCIAGNVACETRESRRGKHPRQPKNADAGNERHRQANEEGVAITSGTELHSPKFTAGQVSDEVAASQVLASLSSQYPWKEGPKEQSLHPDEGFSVSLHRPETDVAPLSTVEPSRPEDETALFLGESTSIRYVSDSTPANANAIPTPQRPRLRHSIPNADRADAQILQWEAERRRVKMKALQEDGAFSFPSVPVREELLRAYFLWFHPQFAIVDESDVWQKHQDGTISPLLLQAMLFLGVIHCEEGTLQRLDWGTRHRAKYLFYNRTKDIYDADYEIRKLTVIQTLFLLSFWRAGALWEKDARHWLGAAVSLAQTRALHRSGSEADTPTSKLRKRLWWSIYIRERQCGSALGLPNRIRDEDCDIEKLTLADFEHTFGPDTPARDKKRYTTYAIGMTQLAHILGTIVDAGMLPNRTYTSTSRIQLCSSISQWRQNLAPEMQLQSDNGEPPNFQASMLHLAYNNLLILLHRSAFINPSEGSSNPEDDGSIALQAAARNSRIVEDMLSTGHIGHSQIHVITNLFNTLCIHVTHMRRSEGVNRTIAEHRAKLCLMGLQELQSTWEVTNWVLQLFFQYLDRETAKRLAMEADEPSNYIVVPPAPASISQKQTRPAPVSRTASHTSALPPLLRPYERGPAQDISGEGNQEGSLDAVQTPWSWTTDEANQYLFSQIENEFAFGEGGMLEWMDDVWGPGNHTLPDLGYPGLE